MRWACTTILDRDEFETLLPALAALYLDAYQGLTQYAYRDAPNASNYLRWLYQGDSNGFFVVSPERDRQVVAFASIHGTWWGFDGSLKRGGRRPVAELHELVVDRHYQGRGIGGDLVRKSVDYAVNLRRDVVELWVGKRNQRAIRLYQRCGFEERDRWRHWIRMELRLALASSF